MSRSETNSSDPSRNTPRPLCSNEDKPEDKFCVRRHDRSGGRVCFSNKEDHILVEWIGTKGEDIKNPISITPTLDDEGKCCYRINGKGLRLCWQVLLMAPENLLFEGLP